MKIDACFLLGYLTGTHGLSGDLHVVLDTDRPESYKDLESVYVLQKGTNALVPFFISKLNIKGDKATIRFDEVDTRDRAKSMVGGQLFLPLDQLPPLEGEGFYYHELIDWKVRDQQQGDIGIVKALNEQSPQPLLVLDFHGKEILVPFSDGIIVAVHKTPKEIIVNLPEGLLEIFLEP